jgi:AhpD family alkylhydroperoxidase
MLFDWTTYKNELTKSIPDFAKLTPDSLKGYQTLSNANKEHSHLGEKMRQLISIAVAVTTRCDGCITFHTDAALKAGATREEISEALGVAMAMNAGAALIYSLRAMDAVQAHSNAK